LRQPASHEDIVKLEIIEIDSTIRIVHLFEYGPHNARLLTEPFEGYGGQAGEE
jgi:hypothetical protein